MSEELMTKSSVLPGTELINSMMLPSGTNVTQDRTPNSASKPMTGVAAGLVVMTPPASLDLLPLTQFDLDVTFTFKITDIGAVKQHYMFSMLLKNGRYCKLNSVYQDSKKLWVYWDTQLDSYYTPGALYAGFIPVNNTSYKTKFEFRKTTCRLLINDVLRGSFATNVASPINRLMFGGVVGNGNYMSGSISDISVSVF